MLYITTTARVTTKATATTTTTTTTMTAAITVTTITCGDEQEFNEGIDDALLAMLDQAIPPPPDGLNTSITQAACMQHTTSQAVQELPGQPTQSRNRGASISSNSEMQVTKRKHSRPLGSKDKKPHKKAVQETQKTHRELDYI